MVQHDILPGVGAGRSRSEYGAGYGTSQARSRCRKIHPLNRTGCGRSLLFFGYMAAMASCR